MSRAPFIPLARIIKAHGLKGEVSVKVLTDLPFDIPEGLHVWLTPPPAAIRQATVESVRPGPKGPLVKLSGVETIDVASTLRGST
ncbi:MAG: 16S rRNA processing protein RimM, partial [Coriobacteriia bacterium]|nr:16S rRNA processing protein RimM [Coriobacteriia bacterium]